MAVQTPCKVSYQWNMVSIQLAPEIPLQFTTPCSGLLTLVPTVPVKEVGEKIKDRVQTNS